MCYYSVRCGCQVLNTWLLYFLDCKMHFSPPNLGGNGGASYNLNVAYLARYRISALKDVINILPHFLFQNFFSYFPPLKPRCVLWSKNMVYSPLIVLSYIQSVYYTLIYKVCVSKSASGGKQPLVFTYLHII